MKIRRKINRRAARQQLLYNSIADASKYIVSELRRQPFTVKHEIKRNIPRPTSMSFYLENNSGQRWVLPYMDLSYKYGAPVYFPLHHLTGREEDISVQVCVGVELNYDPRVES